MINHPRVSPIARRPGHDPKIDDCSVWFADEPKPRRGSIGETQSVNRLEASNCFVNVVHDAKEPSSHLTSGKMPLEQVPQMRNRRPRMRTQPCPHFILIKLGPHPEVQIRRRDSKCDRGENAAVTHRNDRG
jgi:hypothetical protein